MNVQSAFVEIGQEELGRLIAEFIRENDLMILPDDRPFTVEGLSLCGDGPVLAKLVFREEEAQQQGFSVGAEWFGTYVDDIRAFLQYCGPSSRDAEFSRIMRMNTVQLRGTDKTIAVPVDWKKRAETILLAEGLIGA